MVKFWGIPDGHATVIRHGIDLHRFSPDETRIARTFCRHRFGLQQPFFLSVARPEHPGDNHVRLITAFEQFKTESRLPWQLVLAGSDGAATDIFSAAIARSPARNDIRALGFVSAQDLPMLYRDAGVFVYPSLHDGFGLPALEAMASGCPVLCSTRGALGEVVGEAAATVDPEDVTELKDQMIRLAGSDDLRRTLRAAGLKRSKHFDWDQTAAQTLAVYSRAATAIRNHQTRVSVSIQPVPGPPIWRETV
jgi:glycosyltransferase involved in cell wall biosynthesis